MRLLFELVVFIAVAALAIGVIFILALAVGSPFDIRPAKAAIVALLAVLFWFPAFANVHLALTDRKGASQRRRICAAVRAFGMLLCSVAIAAGFLINGIGLRIGIPVFLAGMILNFGTIPFER